MTLDDLIREFRLQVADVEKPYLWSDDEVFSFAVDAQDMFVRETGGIPDSTTPELTKIKVKTDQPYAAYSPYILRFRAGRLLTAKTDVQFINYADITGVPTNDYGTNFYNTLDDDDTGPVDAAILGLENHKIRWYRVPDSDDTCQIQVFRLPYPRLVIEGSVPLEIDEHHHRHLIMWMKYLAYSKQDAEMYDKKAAEDNELAFTRYCEKAKREAGRLRFKPRVVRYGGL
jgi:hypothetical protein